MHWSRMRLKLRKSIRTVLLPLAVIGIFILVQPLQFLTTKSSTPSTNHTKSSPSSTPPTAAHPNISSLFAPFLKGGCAVMRPREVAKAEGGWQKTGGQGKFVFVYSAFYDDRPNIGLLPQIRIIAMATIFRQLKKEKLFCFVFYDRLETAVISEAIVNETGANLYHHKNLPHGEFTITCPLIVSYPVPSHVSVSLQGCPDELTTYTEVNFSVRRKPISQFGICVVNGYGAYKPEQLIEWFETYLHFGVVEFNLYNTSYDPSLTPIFDYYQGFSIMGQQRGILAMRTLAHPTSGVGTKVEIIRNLRSVAMNDCLLRSMYRYHYILTVDHDEFVTPRNAPDYHSMLHHIYADPKGPGPNHFSYTFHNFFFLKEFHDNASLVAQYTDTKARRQHHPTEMAKPLGENREGDRIAPFGSAGWQLVTERYVHRTKFKEGVLFYATKSIVDPLYCFNLFNHYCFANLPPYVGVKSYHVPVRIAANHHYRVCGKFYETNCSTLYAEKTFDGVSLAFAPRVKRNVINVYNKLFPKRI